MLEQLQTYVHQKLKNSILESVIAFGDLTFIVSPDDVINVLYFLRDDESCGFKQLIDLCGVDYPEAHPRFEVVYHLLSLRHNVRVRVKVRVDEGQAVPSGIVVFKAAGWYERETWDMYGIPFTENPDLRRILTDYGFDGFPLRKDFPLTGYVEVRYDQERQSVIYEPVKLPQEYRTFDFESPWEGTPLLPGDEKAGEKTDG